MRGPVLNAYPELERHHLYAKIAGTRGQVAICGPRGSGKSVLAQQLETRSTREIIDVHAFDDFNCELVAAADSGAILVGRGLQIDLCRSEFEPELVLAGPEIWFTFGETQRMTRRVLGDSRGSKRTAQLIHERTSGWPWGVTEFIKLIETQPTMDIETLIDPRHPHLQRRIRALLSPLSTCAKHEIEIAARFDELHEDYFSSKGGSVFESPSAVQAVGIPLHELGKGMVSIIEPVRSVLLEAPTSATVSPLYVSAMVERFGLPHAVGSLVKAGFSKVAVQVLKECRFDELDTANPLSLFRVINRLDLSDLNDPQIQIEIAQLLGSMERYDHAAIASCKAKSLASGIQDRSVDYLRAENLEAQFNLRASTVSPDETGAAMQKFEVTDQRLINLERDETRVEVLARSDRGADLCAAVTLGSDTAEAFSYIGRSEHAARLYLRIALGPSLQLGRYCQMIEVAEHAFELSADPRLARESFAIRSLAAALSCDWDAHTSYLSRLEHDETTGLGGRSNALAQLSSLIRAAHEGDVRSARFAIQHITELIEACSIPVRVLCESQAVVAFCVLNDFDTAIGLLARLDLDREHDLRSVLFAEYVFAARTGDLTTVSDIGERLRSGLLPTETWWRLDLEACAAAVRAGVPVEQSNFDQLRFRTRAAYSPRLARRLIDTTARDLGCFGFADRCTGYSDDGVEASTGRLSIHVFGSFLVSDEGREVSLPVGKPTDLVKIVALCGGRVRVESAIDLLWPDTDVDTGRRRIKNVVSRVRSALHSHFVRSAGFISLGPNVVVDLATFRSEVAIASAALADSDDFWSAARCALEIARKTLLPDDPYAEWAQDARWAVESASCYLIEQMISSRDLGLELKWVVDVASELFPNDDTLLLALARRANDISDHGQAQRALRLAARACSRADFAFEVPNDLTHLHL